jgi:hypothetical protein
LAASTLIKLFVGIFPKNVGIFKKYFFPRTEFCEGK